MNHFSPTLIRNFSVVIISFFCISAKSEVNEVDRYINCKMQYEQIGKYIKSLEDLRRDILPISDAKHQYMSSLRFRALNGSTEERRDAAPKYYGDADYEIFNLNLIIGFALRDLREFSEKRNWVDDRLSILQMVHKSSEFNFYSNNNPFSFIAKEIDLSREMSILAHNINISLLAIKARNQSYKIRNLDFYLATGNDGHWTISNLLSCHIRYLGDAFRYFYDEAKKPKK